MKAIVSLITLAFALSLCNLMGRKAANVNSGPSPTEVAQSSPASAETPPAPPQASPSPAPTSRVNASNRNANERNLLLKDVPTPPQIQAVPHAAPGMPGASRPATNANREPAASVPEKPTTISGGVLNGRATFLPKPAYPPIARAAHASGTVNVQVVVDENGNVISASAVSGHPLLQASAVAAARQAKFKPTKLSGQPVKVTGLIVYNFVEQ